MSTNNVISKNYYLRLDDSGRLTLELTEEKPIEECIKLTMKCLNDMFSKTPEYNSKESRNYFQPNWNPSKAHKNGYRLGVRETVAKMRGKL